GGNFVSNSNSTLQIQIKPGGTTPGVNNDLLVVHGNATLSGGQVRVEPDTSSTGSYTLHTPYTFLQYTGTRGGTFAGISVDSLFLDADLIYNPQSVAFELIRSATAYSNVAITINQKGVAGYLDAHAASATGDFAAVLDQINTLSAPAARTAFQEM